MVHHHHNRDGTVRPWHYNINTAADAAKALEPLVRSFPRFGTVGEGYFRHWRDWSGFPGHPRPGRISRLCLVRSLGLEGRTVPKFGDARGFYGVIIISTIVGLGLNFMGIDPIKALVFTAVFNGIAAVPLLYLIARINANEAMLGN